MSRRRRSRRENQPPVLNFHILQTCRSPMRTFARSVEGFGTVPSRPLVFRQRSPVSVVCGSKRQVRTQDDSNRVTFMLAIEKELPRGLIGRLQLHDGSASYLGTK